MFFRGNQIGKPRCNFIAGKTEEPEIVADRGELEIGTDRMPVVQISTQGRKKLGSGNVLVTKRAVGGEHCGIVPATIERQSPGRLDLGENISKSQV